MGVETVAAISNIGIIATLVICWAIELFIADTWHMKSSVFYHAELSLWGMEVEHGPLIGGANFMLKGVSQESKTVLERIAVGKYNWQQATQYMCQLSKTMAVGFMGMNGCDTWRKIRSMSIMLGVLIFTGMILLVLGAAFSYQYWFKKPSKKTRIWTRGFLISAPTCFGIGLTLYYFCTKRLAEFPPQAGTTLGCSFVFAVFLQILTLVPIFIFETFSQKNFEEDLMASRKELDGLQVLMSNSAAPSFVSRGPAFASDAEAQPEAHSHGRGAPGFTPGTASVSGGSMVVDRDKE